MVAEPTLRSPEQGLQSGGRSACEVPTTCQPPSAWGKQPWPAVIRDISTTGMSLTLNRRFERGSGLAIELPGEDGTTSTVLARVAETRSFGAGVWLLDCSLISELGEGEVHTVLRLDNAQDGGPSGSTLPAIKGVLFQVRRDPEEMLRWFVKKLEVGGTWPLPRDRVIALRLAGVPRQSPLLELGVRRCKQYGSFWVVDCAFAAAPAEEVLALLTAPPQGS